MTTSRWIALAVMFVAASAVVTADENAKAAYELFPSALGVAYGPISGTGLHYQVWNGRIGYSATAGVVYLPPDQSFTGTTLDYTIGGSIARRVYGDIFANWLTGSLYVFVAGNHRGFIPVITIDRDPDPTDDVYVAPDYTSGSFAPQVSLGAGVGIEIILFGHFSIPAEFGYGASWTITERNLAEAFTVQLYGQTALRYRY